MKTLFYFLVLCGLTIAQKSVAQAPVTKYPVSFPDGIIVGSSAITIPTGTTYTLAVSGGILTEKIRVATNGTAFWADYVFEPAFKLRPLKEVEQFIKDNKHLPDVPSTAEVTQNGIDLAQTQALLLQKVEELTLYVIQQQKEIDRLKKRVSKKK
ncbi:MAG: hypothetical protein V4585_01145 [Bacteroidota bacterium]|jgi:hypothetical protein